MNQSIHQNENPHPQEKVSVIKLLLLIIFLQTYLHLFAQDSTVAPVKQVPQSYYIEAGSYSTRRERHPPSYVRTLSETGIEGTGNLTWLDLGFDYRARFEYRHNDIRRPILTTDYPLLLRTRAYAGIHNIIDPFRLAVEFEDALAVNSKFPKDNRDFNRAELIQAYGELYFKKGFGKDPQGNSRIVFIRFGRQAFEFLDRRLIGLNEWRNTTNNFLGFRGSIGQDKNDWHLDLLALRPVIRLIDKFDKTDHDRDFMAVIGHWRRWSHIMTIEPYYLALNQRATLATSNIDRFIHSPGIRTYGWILNEHVNYDLTCTYQGGHDGNLKQDAFMATAEVGYKFYEENWKPRFSLFYGYVSGDKNPNDQVNNRFERFYGFARPWSSDDYVIPENIVTPKIRVEFEPLKDVRVDGGYSFYWLASSTDRFNNLLGGNNNRDKTGKSGREVGHGMDVRVRFKPARFLYANIGYTHFTNGQFVVSRQAAAVGETSLSSDFAYIELSFNALDLFKPSETLK